MHTLYLVLHLQTYLADHKILHNSVSNNLRISLPLFSQENMNFLNFLNLTLFPCLSFLVYSTFYFIIRFGDFYRIQLIFHQTSTHVNLFNWLPNVPNHLKFITLLRRPKPNLLYSLLSSFNLWTLVTVHFFPNQNLYLYKPSSEWVSFPKTKNGLYSFILIVIWESLP